MRTAGARHGRGATVSPQPRYDRLAVVEADDGWTAPEPDAPRTTVVAEATRTAINRVDSPDLGFDRSLNPYKGCEHGCFYCYARPTHAWMDLSPGLDFETKLFSKPDAPARLREELSRPGYVPRTLVVGSNTDAWQPVERRLGITRAVLEVLLEFGHPVAVLTKSAGILRDVDVLSALAGRGLARAYVSITTLDPGLSARMEPRASSPGRRLSAVERLAEAGVPTGVLAAPMIPAVNDMELERILEAAVARGAGRAGMVLLRLPLELKEIAEGWLATHLPDRKEKVLALLRQAHGGALYDPRFGARQRGSGPWAELLQRRFEVACRRLGLPAPRRMGMDDDDLDTLDTTQFRVPGRATQLRLFG